MYDYFANEALNAGLAWSDNGSGQHIRPMQRRNNYGLTLGGPVNLGRLYDGTNRSFFFFNFEQFYENVVIADRFLTVPTAGFRNGDFRSVITGRVLGTDPLGRPIEEEPSTIQLPSERRQMDKRFAIRSRTTPFQGSHGSDCSKDSGAHSGTGESECGREQPCPALGKPALQYDSKYQAGPFSEHKTKFSFFFSSTNTPAISKPPTKRRISRHDHSGPHQYRQDRKHGD